MRKSKNLTKEAPSKRSCPGRRGTDQGDLAGGSDVGRQMDDIEQLEEVEESTDEEFQNEEETGMGGFR